MKPAFSAAYLKSAIELPRIRNLQIRPLKEENLPFVRAHYRLVSDEDYLRQRIRYGMLVLSIRECPPVLSVFTKKEAWGCWKFCPASAG